MKTAFIGAGKAGCSLGKYFSSKGAVVTSYCDLNSTEQEVDALISKADLLFLTVPDGEISAVWQKIKNKPLKGKFIAHASGALTSDIFEGAQSLGIGAFSIHPCYAISSKETPLDNTAFALEGTTQDFDKIKKFLEGFGNTVIKINKEDKVLYHAACVIVSNLVTGVAKTGKDLFERLGVPEQAWKPLFLDNAKNIAKNTITQALTGPVERADAQTIKQHLDVLENGVKDIYKGLSKALLETAKEKDPRKDYSAVEKELNK